MPGALASVPASELLSDADEEESVEAMETARGRDERLKNELIE